MSDIIVTTGATPGPSGPGFNQPNRLEINALISQPIPFSLYIQALSLLEQTQQGDPASHFQLGGIHGLPFLAWDGAGEKPVDPQAWLGYCTHGSMLFPTWHRPYVALYEQELQKQALIVAQNYTDQATWVDAAKKLRAPYWDWATNSVPPPEVVSKTTVNILTAPDGTSTDVPNPLLSYTFNPIDPSFTFPFDSWPTTLRSPTSEDPDATTDVNALISTLQSMQTDLTGSTYNLCLFVNDWPAFSNHTVGDGGSASNSLEGIHDRVHGSVGGHMGDTGVAAFDPIFFLHHCNVDRILSLWEAIHFGTWVASGPAERGSWTIPEDATIGPNTPLAPFRNSENSYWPSSATTSTLALNYSYPEFNGLVGTSPTVIRDKILQYVESQYGRGRSTGPGGGFGGIRLAQPAAGGGAKAQAPVAAAPSHSRGGAPYSTPKPEYGKEGPTVIYDWTCRIHCKKYELGGSYWVLIFLGEVPEDPKKWHTSSSFSAGTIVS